MTELLAEAIPLVDEIVRSLRRRHRVSGDEADELLACARLKLVEHDHAVLRKFTGRSTLRTYLVTVLTRLLLDQRRQRWGKWRSSLAARRLGPTAVRLEELLYRDGRSFDEAANVLRSAGPTPPETELRRIAEQLPERERRRFAGEPALAVIALSADTAQASVAARERQEAAHAVEQRLDEALVGLGAQERLILRLRFDDGYTVGEIARVLRLEEKPLYKRIERLLERLRKSLEARGVRAADVSEVLGASEWSPRALLRGEGKAPVGDV